MNSTDAASIRVPPELAAFPQWVCWKIIMRPDKKGVLKPTKVPVDPGTGEAADSTDPATWADLPTALRAWADHPELAGIGFVFAADDPFTGIDLDNCVDEHGAVSTGAREIILDLDSYTEISPSGRGVKVFVKAVKPESARCRTSTVPGMGGLEIYDRERFFTFTGNVLPGSTLEINERQTHVNQLCERLWPKRQQTEPKPTGFSGESGSSGPSGFTGDDAELIQKARDAKDGGKFDRLWRGDASDYGDDASAADMALCDKLAWWTNRDAGRMDSLFRQSGLMRDKWDERRGSSTYGADTIAEAITFTTGGYEPDRKNRTPPAAPSRPVVATEPDEKPVNPFIPKPSDWKEIAEMFAASVSIGGICRFLHHGELWWQFRDGAWQKTPEVLVKKAIRDWLQTCIIPKPTEKKPDAVGWMPVNKKNVSEVLEALIGHCTFQGRQPCWLTGEGPDPRFITTFRNGWIDVLEYSKRRPKDWDAAPVLHPPDIRLFTFGAADYDYDPAAECPQFKDFLLQVVTPEGSPEPNTADVEQIRQWFGYTMIPWNGLEKAMFYEGHPCSGKGTTIKVHKAVLGPGRWAATTITKVGSRFGLQPLVGCLAAFDADAHITRSTDTAASLETLKNIIGEDEVSVDRKGVAEIGSVHMPTKFTMAYNEMPSLPDSGASLRRRMNNVGFPNNYEDRQDSTLKDRLCDEKQGIARWAIDGLADLLRTRTFTESMSSVAAREDFVRNSTPILAFVDDCCELSPLYTCTAQDLHKAHTIWSNETGNKPFSRSWLMRRLYAAVREIIPIRGGKNNPAQGVDLTSEWKNRIAHL